MVFVVVYALVVTLQVLGMLDFLWRPTLCLVNNVTQDCCTPEINRNGRFLASAPFPQKGFLLMVSGSILLTVNVLEPEYWGKVMNIKHLQRY